MRIRNICASLFVIFFLASCVTTVTGPTRKLNPGKQLGVLIELGNGYIRNRQYGRAKENLTQALKIDPESPAALNALGLVYQLEGEDDLAESYFKEAVSVAPNFAMARNNFGAFLYEHARYEEAIEQLNVAANDRLYPRRAQVFLNLGVSHLKLGNKVEAEQALKRSLQLNAGISRALLELADLKLQQKDFVSARHYFSQYERSRQKNARSLWICVQLSRVFKNDDKAASCGLMLKNVFPNTYEYRRYEASIDK